MWNTYNYKTTFGNQSTICYLSDLLKLLKGVNQSSFIFDHYKKKHYEKPMTSVKIFK